MILFISLPKKKTFRQKKNRNKKTCSNIHLQKKKKLFKIQTNNETHKKTKKKEKHKRKQNGKLYIIIIIIIIFGVFFSTQIYTTTIPEWPENLTFIFIYKDEKEKKTKFSYISI